MNSNMSTRYPKTTNNGGPQMIVQIPPIASNLALPDPSLLNFYKEIERRVFWITGPVDASLYEIVQYIIMCNYEDKDIPAEQRQPIRLIMACPGGSLEISQTLVATIEASTTPVWAFAIGMCASGGSMIYLACHKRFGLPNTSFMFHQGGCEGLEGSYQQVMAFMEKYQMDIMALAEFYETHTNFSEETITKKLSEGDWYISTDEALEAGIIDEIVYTLDVLM